MKKATEPLWNHVLSTGEIIKDQKNVRKSKLLPGTPANNQLVLSQLKHEQESRGEAGSDGQQAAKALCPATGSAPLQVFYLSSIKLIEQMGQTKNPHTLFLVSPLLGLPSKNPACHSSDYILL